MFAREKALIIMWPPCLCCVLNINAVQFFQLCENYLKAKGLSVFCTVNFTKTAHIMPETWPNLLQVKLHINRMESNKTKKKK